MKRISIFILSLLTCIGMFGQGYETNFFPIMTPEAATLGKFGAYPVSHYTGSVDIKIPIYTLESNGIKIPIYLQYDGGGFIPNKDCGKVGHDWSLVAGGVITRTVNCVPDEWHTSVEADDYGLEGNLSAIRSGYILNNDDVRNLSSIPGIEMNRENAPDLFTFNFGEHHGQFMIDHDGTVKLVGGGTYDIDISGLAIQQLRELTQESRIVITTGDGTKYTFGGTVEEMDISLRMPKGATDKESDISHRCKNGVITAFHLSEIETIDGQKINFSYETKSFKDISSGEPGYDSGPTVISNAFYSDSKMNLFNSSMEDTYGSVATELGFSYVSAAYLNGIYSENGRVEFVYDEKSHNFSKRNPSGGWYHSSYRLDKIKVYNSQDDLIRSAVLHHSYNQAYDYVNYAFRASDCYRMFLDSVTINRDVYSFTYNLPTHMPVPHTRGVDLQGYYNGSYTNGSLLPGSASRGSSFTYASYGMLERIDYPTGGYTELQFENHTYGTLVQKPATDYFMHVTSTGGLSGGLRIKRIKNVPGETITYEYVKEDGSSSGVHENSKQYSFLLNFQDVRLGNTTLFYQTSNNLVPGSTFSESETVYSRVVENRGTGNGKKVYYYTTYADYPDQTFLGNSLDYMFDMNLTADMSKQLSGLAALTSLQLERGKLMKLEEYNGSGALLQKTTYTYSTDVNRMSQAIYSSGLRFAYPPSFLMANSVAHYYYPNQLSKQVVESYDGGTQQTVTEYTYHQTTRELVKETVTNSNGVMQGKKLYYPQDVNGYDEMVNNNQIAHVVKEEQFVGSESNVVKTLEYVYGEFNNAYYALARVKEKIGNNAQHELLTITARDTHRNVLEAKELGKPTTCYLWGYNHQYPVAKLVNISRTSLNSILAVDTQNSISASYFPFADYGSRLEELTMRNPNVQVTLYKQEPSAGLLYSKSPAGEKVFYDYDYYYRLDKVSKESAASVVQQFGYSDILSLPPLDVTSSHTFNETNPKDMSATISGTGGSGEYIYNTQIRNSSGTVVKTSSSNRFGHLFSSFGTYTMTVTVTDKITEEVVVKNFTIAVVDVPFVEFTAVNENNRESYGNYYSDAVIHCDAALTVEFSLSFSTDNGSYRCIIGGETFEGNGTDEIRFTVDLEEGDNYVELRLYDAPNCSMTLNIREAEGGIIGTTDTLYLSMDKAED